MTYFRTGLILLAFIGLVGCATTSKQELSSQQYTDAAMDTIGLDYCIGTGWMEPSTAALGKRFLGITLSGYSVDLVRLNREIAWLQSKNTKPNQSDCNRMSVGIHQRQQTITANNQVDAYNQQSAQDFTNSTKIRNTYCNRIGTQTLCSTY